MSFGACAFKLPSLYTSDDMDVNESSFGVEMSKELSSHLHFEPEGILTAE